jgi:hypothetical protein
MNAFRALLYALLVANVLAFLKFGYMTNFFLAILFTYLALWSRE